MPRKSLAEERSSQILEAFESCIARYGIEGSTLEKIAEEAQMKRTIIRHYIGNREELVGAVSQRLLNRLTEKLADFEAHSESSQELFIAYLFDNYASHSYIDVLLVEQFIAAAEQYPDQADAMVKYMASFTQTLARKLKAIYSNSKESESWDVAFGVTAILFNESSLQPLNLGVKYTKASQVCVSILMQSLVKAK